MLCHWSRLQHRERVNESSVERFYGDPVGNRTAPHVNQLRTNIVREFAAC